MIRTGITEHENWDDLILSGITGQRGDKAYVRRLGLCNWDEGTSAWNLIIPNEGNFGQAEAYDTYTDFNTKPKFWGWDVINGSTHAPNTISSVWYRNRVALAADYQGGIQGGRGYSYWMELAVPRYNQKQAGVWTRTCENGGINPWVAIAEPVPAWTAPTLTNGWVNYGGTFNSAAYRKIGKIVTLRGLIKSGTMGAAIMTLPAGYRPVASCIFTTLSNNVIGRVDITAAGVVSASVGTNAWIALDGISFSID